MTPGRAGQTPRAVPGQEADHQGGGPGSVGAGPALPPHQRAEVRLSHLSEIGRLFASFDNAQETINAALVVVGRTVPLRSAILIEAEDSSSNWIVWPSEGQTAEELDAVKRHAEAAYIYLMGGESPQSVQRTEHAGVATLPRQEVTEGDFVRRVIVVPLVVARRPIFGAFQLEAAQSLNEADLLYVNAVVNLLSIGLDRDRAWRLDIERREWAEEARVAAVERTAAAERERLIAEQLQKKYEALAAENATLYEQARQAVLAREQILAVVSHDLRNPIHTILMTVDVLAQKAAGKEAPAAPPEALARIQRAGQRMLRLIGDLLDFASIQAGSLAVRRELQDAGAILLETLALFESDGQAKQLRMTAEVAPDIPQAYCDRDRILQVFGNLVGNAINASSVGGNIKLRVEDRGHELLLSVQDDGPGFSEEDAKHLFDRYWRGDESGYKGTGLGLAIARGIVGAHGGRIWAESKPGRGASFFFTLPAPDDRRHTARRTGEPLSGPPAP